MMLDASSHWAKALLPFAPTREVADALFAHIPDTLLFDCVAPAVGLSFPKGMKSSKELSAPRAEALAAAMVDPDDLARFESDARRGVRRRLAANPHMSPKWVEKVSSRSIRDADIDTMEAVAGVMPFEQLASALSVAVSDWQLTPVAQKIAPRLGEAPLAVAVEVARAIDARVKAEPRRNLWSAGSACDVVMSGLARHPGRTALLAVEGIVAPLLVNLPVDTDVDDELVDALLANRSQIEAFVAERVASRQGISDDVSTRSGLSFHHLDPEVSGKLLRSGCPPLVAAAASSRRLPDDQVEFLLGWLGSSPPNSQQTVWAVALAATNPHLLARPAWRSRIVETASQILSVATEGVRYANRPIWLAKDTLSSPTSSYYTADEVVRVLRASHSSVTTQWLRGGLAVHPTIEQVEAIREDSGSAFDGVHAPTLIAFFNGLRWATGEREVMSEQEAAIALEGWGEGFTPSHAYRDAVAGLVCSPEILKQVVRYAWQDPSGGMPWETVANLLAKQGVDPELWTTFCNLAPNWPADVVSLAETAAAVSA